MHISREDVQIISRHSTISEHDIQSVLKKEVYNDKTSWQQFLQLFFMSLGVSFTVAGILFFFAYNWSDLHKFVKIGLVEGLIVVLALITVFTKIKPLLKNILLSGVSVLVGVLFAVFGQVYQTGANAYDFFFGWTLAIMIWVLIADFAALWLIFIVLINTTFSLYLIQVAHSDGHLFIVVTTYIIGNAFFLLTALFLKHKQFKIPNWFIYILALTLISITTYGLMATIFERDKSYASLTVAITLILYVSGLIYALKQKSTFFIAIILLSVILVFFTLLIDIFDFGIFSIDEFGVFILGLFIIITITLLIKLLMNLQKKWKND